MATSKNPSVVHTIYIYIWLIISSCCGSIPLTLGLIGRDGGLNTLCHSCGFACQQRVLNTLPGPGYLHSEDGVVWLWHSVAVVNLYIYTYIYIFIYIYIYILPFILTHFGMIFVKINVIF